LPSFATRFTAHRADRRIKAPLLEYLERKTTHRRMAENMSLSMIRRQPSRTEKSSALAVMSSMSTDSNTSVGSAAHKLKKLKNVFSTRAPRDLRENIGPRSPTGMPMPPRLEQPARGSQETSIIKSTTNDQNFVNGGATNKKGCDENTSRVEPTASSSGTDQMEGNNFADTYLQEIEELLQKPEARFNDQRLQLDDVCRKLKEVEQETAKQIQMLKEQLQAKDEMIDRLRAKATEAASKTTEMSIGPSLLRLPESEIIKAWQTLHYEVRNFVMNYMKNASDRKLQNWTESQGLLLREITPSYKKFVTDRKCGSSLIEAAIWSTLMRLVFSDSTTSGSICWAGKYARKVSKLSKSIETRSEPDFSPL
jgi:hypothetical protein